MTLPENYTLMHIDWSQMIGDCRLWEIVSCVGFVIVFFAISLIVIAKKAKEDADRRLYPTISQVQAATSDQIRNWVENLPVARSQRELDVIGLIIERYFEFSQQDELHKAPEFKKEYIELIDQELDYNYDYEPIIPEP